MIRVFSLFSIFSRDLSKDFFFTETGIGSWRDFLGDKPWIAFFPFLQSHFCKMRTERKFFWDLLKRGVVGVGTELGITGPNTKLVESSFVLHQQQGFFAIENLDESLRENI